MVKKISRKELREKRKKRVRKKIRGTQLIPRLCIYKSLKNIYSQLIDDEKGETIFALSTLNLSTKEKPLGKNKKAAEILGHMVAEKAKEKGITKVVFDRSGYRYHGKVKAFADAAREGGLQF